MENQEVNPIPVTPSTPTTPVNTIGGQIMMPGAIMYMVFGIVSCCLCWEGFIPYAGIVLAIAGLVLGILAWTKGKKMQKEFDATPANYKPANKVFIKVATITGLVGFILSAVFLVIGIILTIVAAVASTSTYYY
jgi:hypothetical protein